MKLEPFQKEVVKEIIDKKGKVILAMDCGLGKTVVSCAFLNLFKRFPKTLIIIPPALYKNWLDHLKVWIDKPINIQYVANGNDIIDYSADVYVVSYQIFTKIYTVFPPVDAIILDEAHYIKNPRSARTKAVFNYLKYNSPDTHIRLLLTGTPIYNRPIDLWALTHVVKPNLFPSFWKYAKYYCKARQTVWGYWDFSGCSHLNELKQKIKPIMVRRTWDDVDITAPPLIRKPVRVGVASTEIKELDMQITAMEDGLKKEQLKTKQRQLVGMKKIKKVADLCIDLLNKTERIVLFAWHRNVIESYQKYFTKYRIKSGIIYGSLTAKQKITLLEQFKQGKIQILIVNWLSGGVGLNMEFCRFAVFGELDYVPANIVQATARVFRLTSKKPVFVYFPYIKGSYEERIIKILLEKETLFKKVIGMTNKMTLPWIKEGKQLKEKEIE